MWSQAEAAKALRQVGVGVGLQPDEYAGQPPEDWKPHSHFRRWSFSRGTFNGRVVGFLMHAKGMCEVAGMIRIEFPKLWLLQAPKAEGNRDKEPTDAIRYSCGV